MAKKDKARPKQTKRNHPGLPHLDESGAARMVDVAGKDVTHRVAVAEAFVRMSADTLELLKDGAVEKGDAFAVARIAGIQGAKKTSELIPLAHPITLTHVAIKIEPRLHDGGVYIEARVESLGLTGVEMEAMTAAATAALSLYDMVKKYERGVAIERLQLQMKTGGLSGTYIREG
jgi:cyclic pyranopterin monophosphate synthase